MDGSSTWIVFSSEEAKTASTSYHSGRCHIHMCNASHDTFENSRPACTLCSQTCCPRHQLWMDQPAIAASLCAMRLGSE